MKCHHVYRFVLGFLGLELYVRAIKFYKSLGFSHETAEKSYCYAPDGSFVNDLIMVKISGGAACDLLKTWATVCSRPASHCSIRLTRPPILLSQKQASPQAPLNSSVRCYTYMEISA